MRKILLLLFTFILAIAFVGCNSNNEAEELYSLIKQHKQLEDLTDFTLTYEQIQELADKTYVVPDFFIKDSKEIFRKGNLILTIGDLKGLTDKNRQKYKKVAEELQDELFNVAFTEYQETVQLSEIYEDEENEWKFIFEHKKAKTE